MVSFRSAWQNAGVALVFIRDIIAVGLVIIVNVGKCYLSLVCAFPFSSSTSISIFGCLFSNFFPSIRYIHTRFYVHMHKIHNGYKLFI